MTPRTLTQDQFENEARAAFGDNPMRWAFICPGCGDVATPADFKEVAGPAGMAGQECIGRYTTGRGCTWVAYGLISGPWKVTAPVTGGASEVVIDAFPLAVNAEVKP
ncbi:VVA0879 family protein [Melissospora conviva]|uniref:VVA0879 family protein n=1 Tax=Melissospora conviva TaxID=3388432 RepID=UPI003C2A4E2E